MLAGVILRSAQYLVPLLAIAVAAAVLLGPGRSRPVVGARVWGLSSGEGRVIALRIETLGRAFGVDDPVPLGDLSVEVSQNDAVLGRFAGSTGPDGITEARVESATEVHGDIDLRVHHAQILLAEGRIARRPAEPLPAAGSTIRGAPTGELVIAVEAARGLLAAPFPETLQLSITTSDGGRAPGVTVEASGIGGEIDPARFSVDDNGRATIQITPQAHSVELSLLASAPGGKTGRWEQILPVVPGAIWLDPGPVGMSHGDSGENAAFRPTFVLVSPVPRDRAYLSVISEQGRFFGAVVPLKRDAQGFFSGSVTPSFSWAGVKAAQAVVAGDPFERGVGTVAWPVIALQGKAGLRRVELLHDGLPPAQAREQARAWSVRKAGLFVIAAAAVFEVLLLVLLNRSAQRRLDAHLQAASMIDIESTDLDTSPSAPLSPAEQARLMQSAREHPLLYVAVFSALVLLAFAMFGALAAFR
jgi:hypothetical protein